MELASTIYEAALVDHLHAGAHVPGAIVPGVLDELTAEAPSAVDLVVRRKADGSELLRTPADIGSPDALLTTVNDDLSRLSVADFVAEWRMPQ